MNVSLYPLFITFIIICATKRNALNLNNALRSNIGNLLAELRSTSTDAVLYWNFVTVQAGANDLLIDKSIAPFSDQPGHAQASRAHAIIHGAMYDAMAFFSKNYKPLFKPKNTPNINSVDKKSATDAAIMEAAYQTLCALYVKKRSIFDEVRGQHLRQLKVQDKKQTVTDAGILVGQSIAISILTD